MDTNYAQIKNGIIVNVIVLNDPSLLPQFSVGFDAVIELTNVPGEPGIGWTTTDNINFTAPPSPPSTAMPSGGNV